MRTGLIMLVLTIVLAAVAWLVTTTLAAATEAPTPSDDRAQVSTAAVEQHASERADEALPQPTRVANDAGSGARPYPSDATWVEITVVDGDGTPQPDTEVLWHCGDSTGRLTEIEQSVHWRQPLLTAIANGWQTVTDAEGKAQIACKGGTWVGARRPDHFGQLHLPRADVPAPMRRLILLPDITLRALVLGPDERPVPGVPITLSVRDREDDEWYGDEAMGISGQDGIAEIPHFQLLLGQIRSDTWFEGITHGALCLFLPGVPLTGPKVSLVSPPTEPLVLRTPAFGTVRVTAPHCDRVVLRSEAGGGLRDALVDDDGQAIVDHVPIGRKYTARGIGEYGMTAQFLGPGRAGAVVDVTLRPAVDRTLLRGRIVDDAGGALADTSFYLRLTGKGCTRRRHFRTDEGGCFTISVGRKKAAQVEIESGWVEHADRYHDLGRAAVPARTLAAGVHDVGDLVVRRGEDLIVAGRLLADGEAPRSKVLPFIGRFETDAKGRQKWQRYPEDVSLQLAEDGRFELWSKRVPGEFQLRIQNQRFLPLEPIPFRLGDTDLLIELTSCHSLKASMLLPEELVQDSIQCRAVPTDAPTATAAERQGYEAWINRIQAEHCEVQWDGLPAGTYAIEISMFVQEQPLLRIENVQVPQVGDGDPRLTRIQLTDLFRVVTVHLWDQDREPIEVYGALFLEMPRTGEVRAHGLLGHVTRIPMAKNKTDYVAAVSGFQPTPVVVDRPRVDIQLFSWPEVTLELAPIPELPEGVFLQAALEPEQLLDGSWEAHDANGELQEVFAPPPSCVTVENGTARLRIGNGPHRVRLHVRRKKGPQVAVAARTNGPVLSTSERIRVEIDPAALQRALAQLGKR